MSYRVVTSIISLLGLLIGNEVEALQYQTEAGRVLNACPEFISDTNGSLNISSGSGVDRFSGVVFSLIEVSINCGPEDSTIKSIFINSDIGGGDLKTKSNDEFQNISVLSDGMVSISGDYYPPGEYCILGYEKQHSLNTSHIDVRVCTKKYSPCKKSDRVCISKCCGLNEVLDFDGLKPPVCQPSGDIRWKPFIYKDPYERAESQVLYDVAEGRYENFMANCDSFEKLPGRKLMSIHRHWKKSNWRLLSDGSITLLNYYRQWELLDSDNSFCVDGLEIVDRNGSVYSANEEDQIVLVCKRKRLSLVDTTDLESEHQKELLYCVLCYISALFYLLTTFVYLILFSKTNSNVWTILGYVGSLLALKTLVGTCYLINYISARNPNLEIGLETWGSWCLAVSTHFFVLSSYVWIALMSFDLMRTVRSRTLISNRGKKCWKFVMYCLIGWGLPFLTIGVFIILDHVFADPISEVRVPEYGVYNFFIPPEAQGPYMYYIITGILLVNLMFVIISMTSMLNSRRNSQAISVDEFSHKSHEYISFRLFIKLFVLTGSLWFLEVISWLHAGHTQPWYYVVTDIIVQLQSVWTFAIFVCNSRTLKRLRNKFDKVIDSVNKKLAEIIQFQIPRRASNAPSVNSIETTL